VVAFAQGSVVLAPACAMLTSICGTCERPAIGATIPTLVPERDLVAANTLQATVDNATGPGRPSGSTPGRGDRAGVR
jgi:hypothetical protein